MKFKKIISAFAAAICLGAFIGSPVGSKMILQTEAVSIFEMPSDYTYAADWIWNNRIIPERSTGSADRRYNILFDQIIAGKGTLNYVVRWHSTRTITYEQRQKLEPALEKCVNAWTDWLVGFENWPYQHVDVNIVGWAVTDASRLLDLHSDETVYTDTQPYEVQPGESSEIPTVMANAPSELSRFDHFGDRNYQYPGGLDKRFDMYLWATQGFPEIGGCGGDWGQRLADTYYIGLAEGTASDHVQIHELGHAFSFTDYYGGEGASDGYPPGGFPVEGGGSIMMAGSSSVITDFDGWFMRYVWDKIKDEEGRFDLANALPAKEPVNNNGIKGDVNYDTRVDAYDVIMLNNWLTKTDTLINGENADMNVDGMINVIDLCVLKSYILYGSDNNYVPDSGDDFIHASLSKGNTNIYSE